MTRQWLTSWPMPLWKSRTKPDSSVRRRRAATSRPRPKHGSRILDWTELHCRRDEPGASARHVAPPIDASFEGLTFCGTTAFPASPHSEASGMVLYGEADAEDPYDGPMLGAL